MGLLLILFYGEESVVSGKAPSALIVFKTYAAVRGSGCDGLDGYFGCPGEQSILTQVTVLVRGGIVRYSI